MGGAALPSLASLEMSGPPLARALPPRRRAVWALCSDGGQSLVEFALLVPVLLLLVVGLTEFSFVWNSRNTVLFASRDGSMLAAEGGDAAGIDCVILDRIERDVVSPASAIKINNVAIY